MGIQTIYCKATTPPSAFVTTFSESVQQNAILYVPMGCKEKYEAVDAWDAFVNIQELEELGIEDSFVKGDVTVTIQNGAIVVHGITEPIAVEVYSTNGQLLYSGSDTTIPVNERGTYLVSG